MGAYFIRRSEDLDAAYDFMKMGDGCCGESAIWWFNLACYEAQRGQLDAADELVKQAIALDGDYKDLAEKDEDLQPWREERDRRAGAN